MKPVITKIVCALVFFFFLNFSSHAQNWVWAQSSNSVTGGEGYGMCKDLNGNIFMCGMFNTPFLVFGTTTLSSTGNINAYLVKYDPLGNVLWARQQNAMVAVVCAGNAVATDNNGNVFMTGYFTGTVSFGTQTLISAGSQDCFIVKYDANGNALWARSGGGSGNSEHGKGIAVDPSGNSYITGLCTSSVAVWGTYTLTGQTGNDSFLAKYDPNGNILWAFKPVCSAHDVGQGLTCDNSGNLYLSGYYTGTLVIGTVTINPTGSIDSFLARIDPSTGNAIWGTGGVFCTGTDWALSLCNDPAGDLYMSGYYSSPLMTVGTQTFGNAGGYDGYLAKFDPSGTPLWARVMGGAGSDVAHCASAYAGGVYVCGGIASTVVTIGNYTFTGLGNSDNMFIAQYDANGNLLFAGTLPSGGDDESDIVAIGACTAVLGGDYGISPFVLGNYTLLKSGAVETIFAAKFSMVPAIYVPGASICGAQSATLTASGMSTYTWSNNSNAAALVVSPSVTTTYSVSGTNACGSASASVTVTVNPGPTITVVASTPSVCIGNQVVFTASGANTYTWSGGLNNGTPFFPTVSGTYTVTGSVPPGCTGTATVAVQVVPFPTLTPVVNPTAICSGSTATLTATGANSYTWFPGGNNQASVVVTPTGSTTYTLIQANSNCAYTKTINVIVKPGPTIKLTAKDGTICYGNSAVLTASGANTYTWVNMLNDTTFLVTPGITTIYTVTGTNQSNGCTSTQTIQVVVKDCAGITKLNGHVLGIKIYPNPNKGDFTVEFTAQETDLEFLLFSESGQLVNRISCKSGKNNFNVTGVAKGVYFWMLTDQATIQGSGKIITNAREN